MATEFAIHPGLLVHWAGKTIDERLDSVCEHCPSPLDQELTDNVRHEYLSLLKNILKNGLLMGKDDCSDSLIEHGRKVYIFDPLPRVCFTELKLSQCYSHARRYGGLGIVVKRPFLFHRGGRPVIYYRQGQTTRDIFLSTFLDKVGKKEGSSDRGKMMVDDNDSRKMLHFFKPMGKDDKEKFIYYDESEWRIVDGENEYGEYLPLNGWLSGIIYPDSKTKLMSIVDEEIRNCIYKICGTDKCLSESGEPKLPDSIARIDKSNPPMEVPINFCRQF